MIPLPLCPMKDRFKHLKSLRIKKLPKKTEYKSRMLSKGFISCFEGEGLDKLVNITVKGLNIYYYDFGIAYPAKDIVYPIFLYQIIIAPKRVLVLVHYAFHKPHLFNTIEDFAPLLETDERYSEMLLKNFYPQAFLANDVIDNKFRGLVRTTDLDKAHEKIIDLFTLWQKGLQNNKKIFPQERLEFTEWLKAFKYKFYKEDYGYRATKKFLGEKWAKEAFENYLFD